MLLTWTGGAFSHILSQHLRLGWGFFFINSYHDTFPAQSILPKASGHKGMLWEGVWRMQSWGRGHSPLLMFPFWWAPPNVGCAEMRGDELRGGWTHAGLSTAWVIHSQLKYLTPYQAGNRRNCHPVRAGTHREGPREGPKGASIDCGLHSDSSLKGLGINGTNLDLCMPILLLSTCDLEKALNI